MVIEFADNGDLFQGITKHQQNETFFDEQEIWKVFIQVTKGMKALHDMRIMHRDLKSANVFLNKDSKAKLGDMNVSKLLDPNGLNYTQTGTPYYASPEVWRDEPYGIKSDVWSLGCVLYEMIALKPPFRASNMEGLYKKIIKGSYSKIPDQYSKDLAKVVTALLSVKSDERPDCAQILSMPQVQKRIALYLPDEIDDNSTEASDLLKTIVFPRNFMNLTDKLP
jgi:NIMA (never in mitosis gene a)-related kinase